MKPFVELVRKKLAGKQSFEQAVRVGLKAVLVSPEFLFLREKPGKLDDFALASRLSYFLWNCSRWPGRTNSANRTRCAGRSSEC